MKKKTAQIFKKAFNSGISKRMRGGKEEGSRERMEGLQRQ